MLPSELQTKWTAWLNAVPCISQCPIPRQFGQPCKTVLEQQLHGYSDASLLAYGGAIYVRNVYDDLTVSVFLVSSKAKVAPVKKQTVPRLELNGALLLAKLLSSVASDLDIPSHSLYAWSDSTIVLGWLNQSPNQLDTYVANRSAKISSLIPATQWRYVDTKSNPADLLLRGMPPDELMNETMWWQGPSWLSLGASLWPRRPDINLSRELPDALSASVLLNSLMEEIGCNVSEFDRLVRVFCYIHRFITGSKGIDRSHDNLFLSLSELRVAKQLLFHHSQIFYYSSELTMLKKNNCLHKKHYLAALSPYIDPQGMLRVGGRLQQSSLSDTPHSSFKVPHCQDLCAADSQHHDACGTVYSDGHSVLNLPHPRVGPSPPINLEEVCSLSESICTDVQANDGSASCCQGPVHQNIQSRWH